MVVYGGEIMSQTITVNLVGGPFDGTERVILHSPERREIQLAHPIGPWFTDFHDVGPRFDLGGELDLDTISHLYFTYQFRGKNTDTMYYCE